METQQGTPAWFKARAGKVTASRFGAAAGICPYTSRAKALRLAVGTEKWTGNNAACSWGTINEKNAVKDYMIRTGNVVQTMGFQLHRHYDWLGGSPDGLVGQEGMIEVKCPYVKMMPHTRIPPIYYCQVNGLLEILDRQWCDFISWTPTEMKIYRVYRDPVLFEYLLDRYATFFAFMKRGCGSMPKMQRGEKDSVLARIAQSDAETAYDFWTYVEPGYMMGQWNSPPPSPLSSDTEEDEPSSKRLCIDDSSALRQLQVLDTCAPGPAST